MCPSMKGDNTSARSRKCHLLHLLHVRERISRQQTRRSAAPAQIAGQGRARNHVRQRSCGSGSVAVVRKGVAHPCREPRQSTDRASNTKAASKRVGCTRQSTQGTMSAPLRRVAAAVPLAVFLPLLLLLLLPRISNGEEQVVQLLAKTESSLGASDWLDGGSCGDATALVEGCRREVVLARAVALGQPYEQDGCGVVQRSAAEGYTVDDVTDGATLGVLHSCESEGEVLPQVFYDCCCGLPFYYWCIDYTSFVCVFQVRSADE